MTTALTAQSIIINKPLKDFSDVYDLSTPLNAGITISYFAVNGIENLWDDVSVSRYPEHQRKDTVSNRVVDKVVKDRLLNDTIKEVLIYNDSVACMITKIGNTNRYRIWNLVFKDGKWLNFGENGGGSTLDGWRKYFYTYAPNWQNELRRSDELKKISTDTLTFVNYVKQHGVEPKDFLLNALAKYPLVIYGEVHYRKISWNLLSNILLDSRFSETVGTIFVEMPAYQQEEFDRFYASKDLDREILLDIMRSFQVGGWYDKGQYEFFVNVWKLNQTLPDNKQVRVVPVDEQLPWKLVQTMEDFKKTTENQIDRNTRMADVVEQTIKTKIDKRNCLFITGYGHAHKSHAPGSYSSAEGQEPALTAGAQLVQRLSDKNVFIVLQHAPMMHNTRGAVALVRHGLFDAVFEIVGNKPVAFRLDGSPFGKEPFDADFESCFDIRMGNYADNFDAYIFLQPLKDEDANYILYDIWSDKFVDEVKRRLVFLNRDANWWFDIEGEVTKEKIIKSFKDEYEGKKRWSYWFE